MNPETNPAIIPIVIKKNIFTIYKTNKINLSYKTGLLYAKIYLVFDIFPEFIFYFETP